MNENEGATLEQALAFVRQCDDMDILEGLQEAVEDRISEVEDEESEEEELTKGEADNDDD